MKTSIKTLIASAFILLLYNSTFAQNYNTGVGFRLGGLTRGITAKHFTSPGTAIEGIASFGSKSFLLTGLYEKHQPVANAPGLNLLYGGGGHIGFFRYGGNYWIVKDHGTHVYVLRDGATATVAGLDLILGMDYKFNNAPINIGVDIKPFIDFFNGPIGYFDGALSIRFVF